MWWDGYKLYLDDIVTSFTSYILFYTHAHEFTYLYMHTNAMPSWNVS